MQKNYLGLHDYEIAFSEKTSFSIAINTSLLSKTNASNRIESTTRFSNFTIKSYDEICDLQAMMIIDVKDLG